MLKILKKLMNRENSGFSLVELVVAVGILLTLTTGGILGYKTIQKNSRIAFTNQVANEVFTKSIANKIDEDPKTTPFQASQEYYNTKGKDHITILMLKGNNGDPVTILVINDAITIDDPSYFYPYYFYSVYKSEESPEVAQQLAKEAISECIAANGCNNVPRFQEQG